MRALIYNRPGQSIRLQNENKAVDTNRENEITREIPSVTEIDRDSYTPYPAVSVSRRSVRRELRRIRRSRRRVSGISVVLSSLFSLIAAVGVLYLSYSGIYAPESVCRVAIGLFEFFGGERKNDLAFGEETVYSGKSASFESIPVYLSYAPKESPTDNPMRQIAASGEKGTAEGAGNAFQDVPLSGEIVNASEQTAGKSGSDGEVYLPLVHADLSKDNLLMLSNQTKLKPDVSALSLVTPKAYENFVITDEPLVLILHTHATECYTKGENGVYRKDEPTRSEDIEQNVVAVGEKLASTLKDFGIPVIHSKTLHDKASFLDAYTSSLNEANALLSANPSIRFVIDLHRDAIISDDGEKKAPTAVIAGENYAQLMFVIGTNEAGFKHPNWQDNLSFALDMQRSVNEMYPSLMRPINLRSVSFNEQLSPGYVILETGACGNTLEEAKRSAEAFGIVLAKRILEQQSAG